MGFFRKEKNREPTATTKPGSRGSWNAAKRYLKKLAAFATLTAVFGIVYSQTTQAILDLAWRNQISWGTAFSESLIKAMQYGTLKAPELAMHAVEMLLHARVFTALIEGVIPLSVYFMSQFYLVSFLLDVWDGREGEVFRYWMVFVATAIWILAVFGIMNGYVLATGAEVTFNETEIIQNLNQTGTTDPLQLPNGTAAGNQTLNASETGGLLQTVNPFR